MKTTYIFLITGFEEIEAIATIDILRRGGVNLKSVSLDGEKPVKGAHNIIVTADLLFGEVDFTETEMLIIPGGTVRFNEHDGLKKQILTFAQSGGKVAAICAAPAVLGGLGLLKGKKATCYPGYESYLNGATLVEEPVVVDGNIITGRGPGLTIPFALKLLEILQGKAKSDEIAGNLLIES